jgi:hypothetical protein
VHALDVVQMFPSSQTVPSGTLFGAQRPAPLQVSAREHALSEPFAHGSPAGPGGNTHAPLDGSHELIVHGFSSSQLMGPQEHPTAGSHVPNVQGLASSQSPRPKLLVAALGPELSASASEPQHWIRPLGLTAQVW